MAGNHWPQRSWQVVTDQPFGVVESSFDERGTVYRVVWKQKTDGWPAVSYIGLSLKKAAACDLAIRLAQEKESYP